MGLSVEYDAAFDYLAIIKQVWTQRAMLALKGTQVVANLTQEQSVYLKPNIPKIIEAVELTSAGLTINGKALTPGTGLGLDVQTPTSPCLKAGPEVRFLDVKTYTRIRSEKDPVRQAALIKQALAKQENPLANLIILQAKTSVAAYDPQRERLVLIEPRQGASGVTCVVSDLDIKKTLVE